MKAKPILFNTDMVRAILANQKTVTRRAIRFPEGQTGRLPECGARDYLFYPGGIKYPPYRPGDILYVRETWAPYVGDYTIFRADFKKDFHMRWHPSIHMPKEVARIFLRVTDVQIQRLKDVTEDDARAEGFSSRAEFIAAILKMYPDCTEESWVWVIEFERISKEEAEGRCKSEERDKVKHI